MEFVLPTARTMITVGILMIVGAMILAVAITTITTFTSTRPTPPSNSTPNTVAIDLTAPDEIDYDDTGDSIEGTEGEDLHYNSIQDFIPNTPPMDIEEAIRRTNANLAERGDPMLSEQEECLARAVASGSDRSVCRGI